MCDVGGHARGVSGTGLRLNGCVCMCVFPFVDRVGNEKGLGVKGRHRGPGCV